MSVSPADFELYSRATGTPLPRTPQEQMRLAPQVHSFIQNRGYQRGPVQRTAGALDNVIGGIRNTALIGAGLLGAGLAASAYANKRDSEPKTPDPDANRYDKAGHVDLSAIDSQIAAENAENLANRPPRQKKEKPQPYVRIPVRTKENYGTPARDLASEAENLSMAITKGDSPVQSSDIVLDGPDEGTTSVYVRDDQLAKTQGKTRLGQWGANVTDRLSKSQGSPMWNWGMPTMSTGIVLSPRPWESTGASWTNPDLGAAGDLLSATGEAAGNVILSHVPGGEIVQNLGGFTGGALKHIPGVASGAASVGTRALELGTVGALSGADRLAHEVARAGIKSRDIYENYLGGRVPTIGELHEGAKTAIGITGRLAGDTYRLGQKTRALHDEKLVPAVRKGIGGTAQLSLNLLTGGNPQTDEPGPDQTRTAPSVGITDETIPDPWENEGIGLGAHIDSGNGGPALDALLAEVREQLGHKPVVSTRRQAETIPYQEFERGEGMGQSESVRSLGIGDAEDTQGLLTTEFHKTPGKVYSFYDEEKQHPLVKETSNTLDGVMKGRRRDKQQGTVYIPQDKADQYYEEMDERLTQEARETDAADFLESKLRKKQVGVDDSFTAGGLVNALKQGGREGFQDYVSRAANLERLDEEGEDAYRQKGGKYPRGWWGKEEQQQGSAEEEQQQGSTEWVRSPDGRLRKKV